MKAGIRVTVFLAITVLVSCSYDSLSPLSIPNGDFENWDGINNEELNSWRTNSRPGAVPPFETYIVQKESGYVQHGQYAALFVYNNVYAAWAENKFTLNTHPSSLSGFVRCDMAGSDTVYIRIKLYSNQIGVDSGQWIGNSSIPGYQPITLSITQNAGKVDSALIRIQGGHRIEPGKVTRFWVDHLALH